MKGYQTGTVVEVSGQDAILSQVNYGEICLIDIQSGNRWHDPIPVDCADTIPISKIKEAADFEPIKIKMARFA